jgi:hypothetical protein
VDAKQAIVALAINLAEMTVQRDEAREQVAQLTAALKELQAKDEEAKAANVD